MDKIKLEEWFYDVVQVYCIAVLIVKNFLNKTQTNIVINQSVILMYIIFFIRRLRKIVKCDY